jgi:hypothetical protein
MSLKDEAICMKKRCIIHTVLIMKYYSDDKIKQRKLGTRHARERGILNPEFQSEILKDRNEKPIRSYMCR